MEFKKNDFITLNITGYTSEGNGVGNAGGCAVFVPGAARGDSLRVRIVKTEKNYAFGRLEEILSPSPERIPVDCPVFRQCGGCAFRHLSYQEELRAKEERVRAAVERIGGFSGLTVRPILGAEHPDRYRNKAQFPIGRDADGKISLGFFANRSHRIIPCRDCLLQPEVFTRAADTFLRWAELSGDEPYDETTGKGRLRHLYLRQAASSGEVMVCVVVNGNGVHREDLLTEMLRRDIPEMTSLIVNSNRERTNVILGRKNRTVWGQDAITDTLCGLQFRISPHAFYQVNRDQAQRLYQTAAQYASLTQGETLLDLYCGTGTIGLSMADRAKSLIGVEIVDAAVQDARENAARNGIGNAEFLCMDAAPAAQKLAAENRRPDVIILDPPRKGCSPSVLESVVQMSPSRVVYVSCDPATLARDLKVLAQSGYQPQELTPVDMFPRTAHVETAALITKEGSSYDTNH